MGDNLPENFGGLPWTTDQYELQFDQVPNVFSTAIFDSTDKGKWKIVHPAYLGPFESEPLHKLERTVTNYIRYIADAQNYTSVIWLGADNVAVTLNYMHQLALERKVNFTKSDQLQSFQEVVTDVFKSIESECDRVDGRALVIYSCAKEYAALGSLHEIQPFVPSGSFSHIDFMILTLHPDNFKLHLPGVDEGLCVPCKLQSEQVQKFCIQTAEMYRKLQESVDESTKKHVKIVLLLVSLLYPNYISRDFIESFIDHFVAKYEESSEEEEESEVDVDSEAGGETASQNDTFYSMTPTTPTPNGSQDLGSNSDGDSGEGSDEETGSSPAESVVESEVSLGDKLKEALDVLVDGFILRETKFVGPTTYCIDRQFQKDFRRKAYEDAEDFVRLWEIVERLDSFLKESFAENTKIVNPIHGLFLRYRNNENGFHGSEAAMHQNWLHNVALKGFVHLLKEDAKSLELANNVEEYISLKFVGRIAIHHRQEALGVGNHKVQEGYIWDSYDGKNAVAVKQLHASDPKKIKREVEKLAKLRSNFIVGYRLLEPTSTLFHYIALELCDQTLGDYVKAKGQVDLGEDLEELARRFKFLRDATKGLKYLSIKKIIHRDIKPSNILLKTDGATTVAKIADFDLSKYTRSSGSVSTSQVVGTEGYMAPEVKRKSTADHKTDMYSFGKVCYFVLSCGKKPNISLNNISFPFDFYGVAETVRALLSGRRSERISAEDLLKYPMFWVYKGRNKFANLFINLGIEYGADGTPFHAKLAAVPLDWEGGLAKEYPNLAVEEMINYRRGNGNKKERREFSGNACGYSRFCRNAIEHAREHAVGKPNLQFALTHYFDEDIGKPNKWNFFKTYFKPFPTMFFKIWKTAMEHGDVRITKLSEKDPEPMDCT